MKKIVCMFLSAVLITLFTACASETDSSEQSSHSSASSSTNSELSINQSQLNNLGKPQHEMSITSDEFIDAVDKGLANKKYSLLSKELPRISKNKDDTMGVTNEIEYDLGNGFILSLYADQENKKLTRIDFFIFTSNATKDSINYYACCADTAIKYLDTDNADKIEEKLDLSNISTNEDNVADTENYSYSYNVADGTDVLMIEPQK